MSNLEKYTNVYVQTFDVGAEETEKLKYQDIKNWDSVGHMELIMALEDAFNISIETEDIVNLNSFEQGKKILSEKYNVDFAK